MITLQPSKSVLSQYTIDFELLSIALSCVLRVIYGKDFKGRVKVYKSRTWDNYHSGLTAIYLNFDANQTDEQAVSTIIHEMRHWQQDKIFRLDFDSPAEYDASTYESYHNSPVEVDARHFQKVEGEVMALYSSLTKIGADNVTHRFYDMYRRRVDLDKIQKPIEESL